MPEQSREIKVYVTEGLYVQMQAEIAQCHCTMTGRVRAAITEAILRNRRVRRIMGLSEPVKPLLGQADIDSVTK